MSKSVREQVEAALRSWSQHSDMSMSANVLWTHRGLFLSAEETEAERDQLQSEVARLRGVIEGTAKWMDREAEEWRELRFFGTGIACRNEASRLRAALSPQPAQGGGE